MQLGNKRICVTGGNGFLGSYVVKLLKEKGANVFVPRSSTHDLRTHYGCTSLCEEFRPEIIIHLAASVGGIGANQENPGRFFYENLIMGVRLIEAARLRGVEKFVQIGTVCSYPKFCPVPFKEEDLWNGYPESTNAPYGIAKKALLEMCQAYRKQYNFNGIWLCPVNLYGPGDNFDLQSSHVIPALIRKCVEAKQSKAESIAVWGTGRASREFLYVSDCADAIVRAVETYNSPEPCNIGTGSEIIIRNLIEIIKKATGYEGNVVFDSTRPDGQPRRCLDVSRAEKEFGFKAGIDLETGIKNTVEWYESVSSTI